MGGMMPRTDRRTVTYSRVDAVTLLPSLEPREACGAQHDRTHGSGPTPRLRPTPRVGVLVVAYNAASTLAETLARLPESFTRTVDHVMVCDDASTDDTYAVGLAVKESSPLPITVVRHEHNLGYGGNQKAGYAWAIEHGLDIVVLLHADGQYAPEEIERLVEPLACGTADAVFGSRMMVKGQARAGGMPTYKYVGNRVLTTFQNRLTGARLTEWHSGYRAYRVDALTDLPLAGYSNGFDFDTEIILGLLSAEKRIVEVPIPTYYGDEICYVNGMSYARDVSVDVVRHWANEHGFGGGVSSTETDTYALKEGYGSHAVLLRWLAQRPAAKVLDAGCFDGRFADMARRQGHHVTGLDRQKLDGVAQRVDSFIEADLNEPLPEFLRGEYDVVVAGDILEHVVEPHSLLSELAAALKPGGEILVSVPELRPLVPPRPHRARQVRLRPARPPRPRPPPLLHPRLDRGADRQLRPRHHRARHGRHAVRHAGRGLVAVARAARRRCRARRPSGDPRLAPALRLPVPVPPGSDVIPAPGTDREQARRYDCRTPRRGPRLLPHAVRLHPRPDPHRGRDPASSRSSTTSRADAFLDGHLDVPDRQPRHRGLPPRRQDLHVLPAVAGDAPPAGADDHPRVRRPAHADLDGPGLDRLRGDGGQADLAAACPPSPGLEEVSRTTRRGRRGVPRRRRPAAPSSPSTLPQPWVYHEAYLWAVASVFGGIYWLVRLLTRPHAGTPCGGCSSSACSASAPARPRAGRCAWSWSRWVSSCATGRTRPPRHDLWWRVLLAGAVPLLISIAINEYKFGTVYLFPLQDQVWTQVNQHRRDALAANGGTITGPQFFTTSFMAYLRPDGIRFTDYFPFITLPAHPAPSYNGAFVDQSYRTGQRHGVHAAAAGDASWSPSSPCSGRARAPRWRGCGCRCWSRS